MGVVKRLIEEIESLEAELGGVLDSIDGIARQNDRFRAALRKGSLDEDGDIGGGREAEMTAALEAGIKDAERLAQRRSEIEARLEELEGLRADPATDADSGSGRTVLAVDGGVQLLEPVTVLELRGVEAALTIIERAIDMEDLSATQEQRVRGLLAALEGQRRQAVPGRTERWKVVGPAWAVVAALLIELPQGVAAWPQAAQVLRGIGWPHVASLLPG